MSSVKRKALDSGLQRRVRPRREPSEEVELGFPPSKKAAPPIDDSNSSEEGDSEEEEKEDGGGSDSDSNKYDSSSESEPAVEVQSVSFGALAKAQAAMNQPSKRKTKGAKNPLDPSWEDKEASERKAGKNDHRDFNRTNKHAPTEISSKKAVSRKREVVPVLKRNVRDPRFDTMVGPVDENKFHKAYSFLDDYREDEMKELKTAIKTTKDEEAKEKLKRALTSMEERKKAQVRKDKEREVLEKHRKEEKELVKQGKQPFYLKKAEQKKRVLLDQFGELKGRKLDRVIERRRKKIEGKEKKNMPFKRRGAE